MTNDARHGLGPFLLNFIEQKALADLYRWDKDFSHPKNQPVASTHLRIFQCPTAEADRVITDKEYPWWEKGSIAACSDYAGVRHIDPELVKRGWVDPMANNQGVMTRNHMTRLAEITDGVSTTLLIAEDAGRPQLWRAGKRVRGVYVPSAPWVARNLMQGQGSSSDGEQVPGRCAINCVNDYNVYSFHPGGANVVFADGSVQFLKVSIDMRVFARLVTQAGGEVVLAGDF